jgi:hypothetical protein
MLNRKPESYAGQLEVIAWERVIGKYLSIAPQWK